MPSSDRQSVVEAAAEQADGASPAAVRAYFRAVPTEELQHRGVAELAELFRGHAELAARRAAWQAPAPRYERGYGWMYVNHVTQADKGCDFDFLVGRSEHPENEPDAVFDGDIDGFLEAGIRWRMAQQQEA